MLAELFIVAARIRAFGATLTAERFVFVRKLVFTAFARTVLPLCTTRRFVVIGLVCRAAKLATELLFVAERAVVLFRATTRRVFGVFCIVFGRAGIKLFNIYGTAVSVCVDRFENFFGMYPLVAPCAPVQKINPSKKIKNLFLMPVMIKSFVKIYKHNFCIQIRVG